jgi:hypothetical protein
VSGPWNLNRPAYAAAPAGRQDASEGSPDKSANMKYTLWQIIPREIIAILDKRGYSKAR